MIEASRIHEDRDRRLSPAVFLKSWLLGTVVLLIASISFARLRTRYVGRALIAPCQLPQDDTFAAEVEMQVS